MVWNLAGGGQKGLIHSQVIRVENLFLAWERFRKGKRRRDDVMIFESALEDNLFRLHEELSTGTYRHGKYERFVVHDPKQRTIHKASVRDRIVHQAIVNIIEPIFERRFIFDSYSCREGKGTHLAVRRLRSFLREASQNNTRTVYVLKCDIKRFFDSVDHVTLVRLLGARISCEKTMALLRDLIDGFSVAPGVGIPLGNLTSQLFANIYLHDLDWYLKQTLRIKHYLRYCDDFIVLVNSYEQGVALAKDLDRFLAVTLKVRLHPDKVLTRTWKQGIDFVGHILLPHATILRPDTAYRALKRVNDENINSYLGLCRHANAYDLERLIRNTANPALRQGLC